MCLNPSVPRLLVYTLKDRMEKYFALHAVLQYSNSYE